jgi:hypothetical protein
MVSILEALGDAARYIAIMLVVLLLLGELAGIAR